MTIKKAESNKRTSVPTTVETGQPRIVTSGYFIDDIRESDLKMPTRLVTFDNMCKDAAVFNSIDITNLLVSNALYQGQFVPGPSGSKKSEIAANFLNYNIRNTTYGTWFDAISNIVTDIKYGFSLLNIVTERRTYGPYKGNRVLKKLAPRDQKSVYGWLWDKDFRELKGFVQKPLLRQRKVISSNKFLGGVADLSTSKWYESIYPVIRSSQLLHFKFNSTNNNPQGDSPLNHCYAAWMEKKLIEEYEVIGVSKDLGGIVVLRVPSELIDRANDPVSYPNEAREYTDLQTNTADLHSGRSSYIVLTSDHDETTKKPLYDFELKGIDGGGKQYNTSEIIDQKKKSIYNVFGTGFLLLGQDNVGSNALALSANSTHGYYVDRILIQKSDVLNNQLAPRLLAVNDIYLNWKDMPVFEPGEIYETDYDTMSKTIQRIGSVNKLTPNALEMYYKKMRLPTDGIEDLDFTDKGQSRAGDGMATAGEGTSNSFGGKNGADASVSNSENAAVKNLVIDNDHLIDMETGEPINE